MSKQNIIFNSIYFITSLLFVLDLAFGFNINLQFLKSFIYYSAIIETPLIIIYNFKYINIIYKKILLLIFPSLLLILILYFNPIKILFLTSLWKTQTIIYQNKKYENCKVEFQMQDIGAFGFNKREVEVFYVSPYFMISSEIEDDIDKNLDWEMVDIDVNDNNLKGG